MWTYDVEPHALKKCELCVNAVPFSIQRKTRDIITAPQQDCIIKITLATSYVPGSNEFCSVYEEAYTRCCVMFSTVMGRMVLPWDVKGICDSCWFNKKGKDYNERQRGYSSKQRRV